MTLATDGVILNAQKLLETTLAACSNWGDRTAYHGALPKPANNAPTHTRAEHEALMPYVILSTDPVGGITATKRALGEGFMYAGELWAEITELVPDDIADDPAAVDARILTEIGKLITTGVELTPGLAELSESVGMLPITAIEVIGPARSEPEEIEAIGDTQTVWLRIEWGVE